MRRTTVSLREDVIEAAKEVVESGQAANISAFVEEAVREKLRRSKRAALYAAYDTAANDPAFVADMADTTRAFSVTDADGLDRE